MGCEANNYNYFSCIFTTEKVVLVLSAGQIWRSPETALIELVIVIGN